MKIIRLQSENVMRLVAVDVTPEGNLVIVGGKNGAGKSSVLNSIAMALGGMALAPAEPIRAGETQAKIEVDLDDDLRIIRRFARSHQPCDCIVSGNAAKPKQNDGDAHAQNCNILAWGETASTLTVTNKEGARYPSPQAMLDKLLGNLTFDPLAFARDNPKRQYETLKQLVHLDFSVLNSLRDAAMARRAQFKKEHAALVARLEAMPKHGGVPDAEISLEGVSHEMLLAEEARRLAESVERDADRAKDALSAAERTSAILAQKITDLEYQLTMARKELLEQELTVSRIQAELLICTEVAAERRALVPDTAVLRTKLAEIEATNTKIRANLARAELARQVEELAAKVGKEHQTVEEASAQKAAALRSATFPVEGLGLNDDGVTFGGLPFSQASSSEQLRVSVAVGLALNPKLKVLLIRSGNLLDDDSLKAVAEQAEAADAQLWCEYVTANPEGVSVMIEDGRVAVETEHAVEPSA